MKSLHEWNYRLATEPQELLFIWINPNRHSEMKKDMAAFDKLAPELRAAVNNSALELWCPPLLLGQRRYGAAAMLAAMRALP